ncbi:MAG: 30S ribosomal protein S3, partial [Ktedonobacterales bacterium]|nr:30S ribosomal protein S3 [Ktedonobacterales bacterium]
MGHKVHPLGFRLGVIKGWQSRWYADEKHYKDLLAEDRVIRDLINKDLANAAVARIEIERVAGTQISVTIFTAKPGVVIGKSGEKVDRLRVALEKATKKKVHPKIMEIRQPELEAILVANSIGEQLEKRISFRRAMKQAVQKTMKAGAKGVKIVCSGRLGGAEIARTEREVEGSVPLQTLRADIDFAIGVAKTTYGTIGIKVWIYRGDVLSGTRRQTPTATEATGERRPPRRDDRPPRRDGDRDRGPRREGDRGGPRRDGGGGARGPQGGGGYNRGPRPEGSGGFRPAGPGAPGAPRPAGEGGFRPAGEGGFRPQNPAG